MKVIKARDMKFAENISRSKEIGNAYDILG
jgi:hypothetical protein